MNSISSAKPSLTETKDQQQNTHNQILVFDPTSLQNQPNFPNEFLWSNTDLVQSKDVLQEPIIDLESFLNDEEPAASKAIELVRTACLSHGVFQVTKHGVDSSLIKAAYEVGDMIFKLPLEKKLKARRKPGSVCGFSGAHADRFSSRLMWKETFSFSFSFGNDDYGDDQESLSNVVNQFISFFGKEFELAGWVYKRHCEAMKEVSLVIFDLLAMSLGLDRLEFRKFFEDGNSITRCNYYPPCNKPNQTLGTGPHCDPTSLTILHQDQVGGLQVFADNKWQAILPRTDALVINIGDTFMVDRILKTKRNNIEATQYPVLEPYLRAAGFWTVAQIGGYKIDSALCGALIERWRPETHTFHLPWGECTVTLEDVAMILSLRVDGKAVTGHSSNFVIDGETYEMADYIQLLLGVRPLGRDVAGSTLSMAFLHRHFSVLPAGMDDAGLVRFARGYIMRLIGGLLCPNKTEAEVHICFLSLLVDLPASGKYSWGSTVLAVLYRYLCKATAPDAAQMGGCLLLLQVWAWYRMPFLRPGEPDLHAHSFPLACRWTRLHSRHISSVEMLHRFREQLDMMDIHSALTNGKFKSCMHRAVVNKEKERRSLVFFVCLREDKIVRPPPQIISGSRRKYPDFTWFDLLTFTQNHYRADVATLHSFFSRLPSSISR